ncbi:hypothetical protein SAMN05518672_11516 [Chitinophaga sp. CF118]|uniref:hypothetical protein n=1 Tax=Chitinophaga sp. CF118 TaxID=1884367 RepID=UPI0008E92E9C|nr:hypothetical protein [Chitinophaga sp. CF118]SFF06050.1 hypothetical protein SAMN05518672_11516 [Chitinophaga sp. CF118]
MEGNPEKGGGYDSSCYSKYNDFQGTTPKTSENTKGIDIEKRMPEWRPASLNN